MKALEPLDCVIHENSLRADVKSYPVTFPHIVNANVNDCYSIEISQKIHIYPERCIMNIEGVFGDYETEKKRFEEYVCKEFGRKLLELGIIKIYGEPENQSPQYATLKAKMNCIKKK